MNHVMSYEYINSTREKLGHFREQTYVPTKSKFGETVKSAAAKKIIPNERVIPKMNSNPWTFFLLYITAMSIVGIN